jgi:hypothetical protein
MSTPLRNAWKNSIIVNSENNFQKEMNKTLDLTFYNPMSLSGQKPASVSWFESRKTMTTKQKEA